jgi:excisionase family DNA binding protein
VKEKQQAQRRLLRIPAAIDYLGGSIKPSTLRQWIWRRKIETIRIGTAVCIPQDALDRIIERGTVPALEQ